MEGLCCADEEALIRKRLQSVTGVDAVSFQSLHHTVTVRYSCPEENITSALRNTGFSPRLQSQTGKPAGEQSRHIIAFSVSALVFVSGLILDAMPAAEGISVVLFILSIIIGGWRIVLKAYGAIRQLHLDMNVLMTAAVLGAAAIDKWEEASAVVVLFSLSHLLEQYSVYRSRSALRSLLKLSPETAAIYEPQGEINKRVEDILIGEKIIVRPGERIPVDGIVKEGKSNVNQSPITGESTPAAKQPGDIVYAGSLNERGALVVEVTSQFSDTVLARMVRLVEESQVNRAPIQMTADVFSRYYTPSVLGVAVLVAIIPPLIFSAPFFDWFYRALVLLVVACPCALIISTPVALFSAMTNAARHGVLIKGGRPLEALGNIKAIAFDKTGTLTVGFPRVVDIISFSAYSEQELLRLAATIESQSEHHLASAVLRKAREQNGVHQHSPGQSFESLTGRGVKIVIDGTEFFAGNRFLFRDLGILSREVEKALRGSSGSTEIIIGTKENVLGVLIVSDDLRSESITVIKQLQKESIRPVMLTGDGREIAQRIAVEAGIDECYSEVLPEEKVEKVNFLKSRYGAVAMVGDGINDAAALSHATVGIAMGKSGTDIAMETADVVLMSDDLQKIPFAITLSRGAVSIIKQNIAIALGTKAIVLLLGIAGYATLWMGILADDGATLLVIMNSLRALFIRES